MDFDMDDVTFLRLAEVLKRECGIVLSSGKKSLAVSRLSRRLRELSLSSFSSYVELLESRSRDSEVCEMINLLTTNVTGFFRERHHFDELKEKVFPSLIGNIPVGGRLRIWSAGCSSGQEPYSIAMTLIESVPDFKRYDVKILATDIDSNVVAAGRRGVYKDLEKSNLSSERINRFFSRVPGSEDWKVSDDLKSLITFEELNLMRDWPMRGLFDIIFCRNVVIYFGAKTQEELWCRFSAQLNSRGHLFVGHSERVCGLGLGRLHLIGNTHYQVH